jgi:16S rRNA (adenine1518-N6/adenine1519-N6)-dimethyltransferase
LAHQARKRFGQHFLVDQGVIAGIANGVARNCTIQGETWVEIGPGLAALTSALIQKRQTTGEVLHAIEIDRDLIARLRKRFTVDQLLVQEADALSFDFSSFAAPLVVVGNLPYNISTPLLIRLIQYRSIVTRQVFMLQKEVVMRMVAQPGTKDYGRLTVMLQAYYRMRHLFDVGPESFDPPPRVDSAIVAMQPLQSPEPLEQRPEVKSQKNLELLLAIAFGQRRKMLRAYFFPWLDKHGIVSDSLSGTARAEEIPVEQWIQLSNLMPAHISSVMPVNLDLANS